LAAPRRIHNAALCHLGLAGPGPCVLAPTRILCPRALILATLGFVRRPAAPWTRSRQPCQPPPGALRPCSQGRSLSPDVSGPASGPLARSRRLRQPRGPGGVLSLAVGSARRSATGRKSAFAAWTRRSSTRASSASSRSPRPSPSPARGGRGEESPRQPTWRQTIR
jgi:hypothetical protein